MDSITKSRLFKSVFHPVALIVFVNITWTCTLLFWIFFFVGQYRKVTELAVDTGLGAKELVSWAPLVLGILLLAALFGGYVLLTFYFSKQAIINKQMRNFLSVVSHELRTPLTSINLFLETMRDHDLSPDEHREFIRNMLADSERLSTQVAGIFDATRLEHGRMPLRKEAVDLERFVSEYQEQQKQLLTSEADSHEFVFDTEPCRVEADPVALRSIVDNLVRNAQRYSKPGTTISISVFCSGKWAVIKVADQGIGIGTKEQKKIFKLFYRSDEGKQVSSKGSGLGLYIVKGIAQLHGGKVQVQSEGADKGASFLVWLPLLSKNKGER